jgi:hypothetical protein
MKNILCSVEISKHMVDDSKFVSAYIGARLRPKKEKGLKFLPTSPIIRDPHIFLLEKNVMFVREFIGYKKPRFIK